MMHSAVFTTLWRALQLASADPGSNAAREDVLDGAPVKVSEGFCRNAKLLESPKKVKALWAVFTAESACLDQVSSSLMKTQKSLKQETFSTSAPSMCRGA